jgi:hypothetical protein
LAGSILPVVVDSVAKAIFSVIFTTHCARQARVNQVIFALKKELKDTEFRKIWFHCSRS